VAEQMARAQQLAAAPVEAPAPPKPASKKRKVAAEEEEEGEPSPGRCLRLQALDWDLRGCGLIHFIARSGRCFQTR